MTQSDKRTEEIYDYVPAAIMWTVGICSGLILLIGLASKPTTPRTWTKQDEEHFNDTLRFGAAVYLMSEAANP